jgi:hypothetical protein
MTSVLDASKELLVEVSALLTGAGAEFVVVGGWSPYLLNSTEHKHPGTKDVDILFSDGAAEGGLEQFVSLLLKNGFMPSAKHDFQLLKPILVNGHELVFNVDLLHPSESLKNPELFTDHFDLHILDGDLEKTKHVRSIVLPSSEILFREGFRQELEVVAPLTKKSTLVPLISSAGVILSKCESVHLVKRPRDSFDIYIALISAGAKRIASAISPYKELDGVRHMLESLGSFVAKKSDTSVELFEFDLRVSKYVSEDINPLPSVEIARLLAAI